MASRFTIPARSEEALAKFKSVYAQQSDIPEGLRDFFVQVAEGRLKGKWVPEAEETEEYGIADTGKLTRAMTSERAERERVEKELKKFRDAMGDDDPVEAKKALERIRKGGADLSKDEAVQQAIQAATGELTKKLNGEITARDGKITNLTGTVRKMVIRDQLRDALSKAGVRPSLAEYAARHAEDWADVDGIDEGSPKLVFLTEDRKGKRYATDGSLLSADAFVQQLREKTPDLFSGPGAEGGGRSGDTRNGGAGGGFSMTEDQIRKDPGAYQRMTEAAAKDGKSVQILK